MHKRTYFSLKYNFILRQNKNKIFFKYLLIGIMGNLSNKILLQFFSLLRLEVTVR